MESAALRKWRKMLSHRNPDYDRAMVYVSDRLGFTQRVRFRRRLWFSHLKCGGVLIKLSIETMWPDESVTKTGTMRICTKCREMTPINVLF